MGKNFRLIMNESSYLEVNGHLFLKDNCTIDLGQGGKVYIGSGCFFNNFTSLVIHSKLSIGNEVICGEGVKIYDNDHLLSDGKIFKKVYNRKEIILGNNIWLANYVNVLKGSVINDNVVVGALSLVNKELESGYIYAGIPVTKIKRF